jgi:uncharacterized protein
MLRLTLNMKLKLPGLIKLLIHRSNFIGIGLVTAYLAFILWIVTHYFAMKVTPQYLSVTAKVETVNTVTVSLEVASSEIEKYKGLRHRRNLQEDRGMLFIFSPPQNVIFTMEDILIPLDIIYIKDGTILATSENAPPCKSKDCTGYTSGGAIDYALEVNAGLTKKLGLNRGEKLKISFL